MNKIYFLISILLVIILSQFVYASFNQIKKAKIINDLKSYQSLDLIQI